MDPDIWKQLPTVIDRKDIPDDQEPTPRQEIDAELQGLDDQLLDLAHREHADFYAQDDE